MHWLHVVGFRDIIWLFLIKFLFNRLKVILLWLVHIRMFLVSFRGLPGREMKAFFLKSWISITHSWHFCHNSITITSISFKPQKVCITLITLSSYWFSSDSLKWFALKAFPKLDFHFFLKIAHSFYYVTLLFIV